MYFKWTVKSTVILLLCFLLSLTGTAPSALASVSAAEPLYTSISSVADTSQSDQTLAEVRNLLQTYYVDPVSDAVLNATTVADMLKGLNDPWAAYYTAEEYQTFINAINNQYVGIGIYAGEDGGGVLVQSVIGGSPAESAGLQAGDLIMGVNGQLIAGMALNDALNLIKGEAGTTVTLTVARGQQTLTVSVVRQAVEEPTVTGQVMDGGIGYISINSFGSNTAEEFAATLAKLQQEFAADGANPLRGWIIDLQDNTGGYIDSAAGLGSYLFGNKTLAQLKDRTQTYPYGPETDNQVDFKAPVIFLTNGYTASASEMVMGAVKDYRTGLIMGTPTYGKGLVQSMFQLSDGSVVKFTTYRFFSPDGNVIQGQGIIPDLNIAGDPLDAARLLLSADSDQADKNGVNGDHRGFLQVTAGDHTFYIDQSKARSTDLWQPMTELISSLAAAGNVTVKEGTENGWAELDAGELSALWPAFYPDYAAVGNLENIPLNKVFTVTFNAAMNWDTVNGTTVELIDKNTGESIPCTFTPAGDDVVKVAPTQTLKAGTEYWLVIHPGIMGANGGILQQGVVCTAKTVAVSSLENSRKVSLETADARQAA